MRNVYICTNCGGEVQEIEGSVGKGRCIYCRNVQPIPKVAAYQAEMERAYEMRRSKRYDVASSIYESIIEKDAQEPEAYWGKVICEYQIEYVEDYDKNYKPTCNILGESSILDNPNYKMALQYAEDADYYKKEATKIDAIQRHIQGIVANEKPYDVFISFKATDDETGNKTIDSKLAYDLYNQLTKKNHRVFFSEVTLKEEHAGEEYEPYIYAALSSATVLVVFATNIEYLNSRWVKNEWSRYIKKMNGDSKKVRRCLPVFDKNLMNDEKLDFAFRKSQISFMDNNSYDQATLVNNIERVLQLGKNTENSASDTKSGVNSNNREENMFNDFMAIAREKINQGNFSMANQYLVDAEKYAVSGKDGERAWLSLLCKMQLRENQLKNLQLDFSNHPDFLYAVKNAKDESQRAVYLQFCNICQANTDYQKSYNNGYANLINSLNNDPKNAEIFAMCDVINKARKNLNFIKIRKIPYLLVALIVCLTSLVLRIKTNGLIGNGTLPFNEAIMMLVLVPVSSYLFMKGMAKRQLVTTPFISTIIISLLRIGYFRLVVKYNYDNYRVNEYNPFLGLYISSGIIAICILIEVFKIFSYNKLSKDISNAENQFVSMRDTQYSLYAGELENLRQEFLINANEYQKKCLQVSDEHEIICFINTMNQALNQRVS